ncbi:unnamed protein product [Ixodes hexagonus]
MEDVMDMSLDPCRDFFSYVCGNWERRYGNATTFDVIAKSVLAVGSQRIMREALSPLQGLVTERVMAAIQTCLDVEMTKIDNSDAVTRFLSEHGVQLPPVGNETTLNPLQLMMKVNLALGIPAVFMLRPLTDLRTNDRLILTFMEDEEFTGSARTAFYLLQPRMISVANQFMEKYRDNPVPFAQWMTLLVHSYFASASSYPLQKASDTYASRCVNYVEYLAPHALNSLITESIVSTDQVETAKHILRYIKNAFPSFLNWTRRDHKDRAVERVKNLTTVFGIPRRFYSPVVMNSEYHFLPIFRGSFAENILTAYKARAEIEIFNYAFARTPRKMELDLSHKVCLRQAANAHYYRHMHAMYIPSVMMSDLTIVEGSLAASYGLAGSIVAHEMGHVFDPTTGTFSAYGLMLYAPSLPKDMLHWEGYKERLNCIVRLYESLGVRLAHGNYSIRTRDENFADIAGLEMVLVALESDVCVRLDDASPIKGLTNRQLFYVARCFLWCTSRKRSRLRSPRDPHAAIFHRCNVVLAQSADFRNTFKCTKAANVSCPIFK